MKILFITAASHTPSQSDYNHFQRVDYLSRHADLTIWGHRDADFTASAKPGTAVMRATMGGKVGLVLMVILNVLLGRARKFDIVLTEPSLLSLLGPVCKIGGAGKWVVDVWDVPGRIGGARSAVTLLWLRLNRFMLKQAFRFADFFLLSIRPDFEFAYFDIPADRMLVMKNAIRVKNFQPGGKTVRPDAPFNILCTRSSYHSDMGLDTIAVAFAKLRASGAPYSMTVVGRIPDELQAQIAPIADDPNVEFAAFLEKEVLMKRIEQSDVCVVPFKNVPDLAQTYPIKVFEYMALARPVIVSDIGGMSELVADGENGLHFRAGDALDLAEKIESLRENPELAAHIARNARRDSLGFDYEVKGRGILDVLKRLAA